ncbi:hypothetical protein OPQ81_001449 [Rhizoctonia solani]|nr:hypothetical protein OPQ81_001449 [Rhizoctonia solani]
MAPPPRLVNWLKTAYARPQINLEWLTACYEYVTGELGVASDDFESLKTHVEEQLLQSSLADSAVRNTGFPDPNSHGIQIKNTLCEVVAITEIGHSAFTLKNVRQARVDKEDLAGLAGDLEDGEDYSIPKYPRKYRRIPDFELGVTPLGTKIYLKEVSVRRGIIYLEPRGIQIKGYQTEELEEVQDRDFVRGLRLRMRLPEEEPETGQDVLGYEDSYSIGDGIGVGHDGDIDEGEEDYEIDEAFLQGLDEAEQHAQVVVQDVIDIDEDSQVEVLPPARPKRHSSPARAEEVIDISD